MPVIEAMKVGYQDKIQIIDFKEIIIFLDGSIEVLQYELEDYNTPQR